MSDKMSTHTDGRNTILQQDLTIKENPPGSVLVIHLFMEEQCSMPVKNMMLSVMERKYEDVDCSTYSESMAGFAVENSGKMLSRQSIVNSQMPPDRRFIYYAVNVRYFNILGGDSMLIDSLGMSTLFLPDVQFHFHGMDPNPVFSYAYNLLS